MMGFEARPHRCDQSGSRSGFSSKAPPKGRQKTVIRTGFAGLPPEFTCIEALKRASSNERRASLVFVFNAKPCPAGAASR
jgi:hypothetical protein